MTDYVVMVSRGKATDDEQFYNSEFWWDIVSLYSKIRSSLFPFPKIIALYGDGQPYACQNPSLSNNTINIYGDCRNGTLGKVFKTINHKIKKGDSLIVWWLGHGTPICGMDSIDLASYIFTPINHCYENEILPGSSLDACKSNHDWFWKIVNGVDIDKLRKRLILVSACDSGRLINHLKEAENPDGKTLLVTSCSSIMFGGSYAPSPPDNLIHTQLDWHLNNSFTFDFDQLISNLNQSFAHRHIDSNPQIYRFGDSLS